MQHKAASTDRTCRTVSKGVENKGWIFWKGRLGGEKNKRIQGVKGGEGIRRGGGSGPRPPPTQPLNCGVNRRLDPQCRRLKTRRSGGLRV